MITNTAEKEEKSYGWLIGVSIFLVCLFVGQADSFKGLFKPIGQMVHRETSVDKYGSYTIVQELLNTGRAGTIKYSVIQNNRIVCNHFIYLEKGERRTINLKCPAMRDGQTNYRTEPA